MAVKKKSIKKNASKASRGKSLKASVSAICKTGREEVLRNEVIADQSWDDIDTIANAVCGGIVTLGKTLNDVLNVKGILKYVEDPKSLKIMVTGVMNDLQTLSTEASRINSDYPADGGKINDESELALAIDIYQRYQKVSDQLLSVVTPLHAEILILMNRAGIAMKEAEDLKETITEVTH